MPGWCCLSLSHSGLTQTERGVASCLGAMCSVWHQSMLYVKLRVCAGCVLEPCNKLQLVQQRTRPTMCATNPKFALAARRLRTLGGIPTSGWRPAMAHGCSAVSRSPPPRGIAVKQHAVAWWGRQR